MPVRLCLAQDPAADGLLSKDPFALLTGMLLDQQFPMERAFAGPYLLASRLGTPNRLDPKLIVATDEETLRAAAAGPPAIHRYPGSMVMRVHQLAEIVVTDYRGRAATVWTAADTGAQVRRNLQSLPGFGAQKAAIFTALLGKQLGVRPEGWREAAGPYGEAGSFMSVADVVDADSLAKVRAFKKERKAAAKSIAGG